MRPLSLSLIEEARGFLDGRIRKTPVEHAPDLEALLGVPVYLKLEFLQITGSFKLRGALFSLSLLDSTQKRDGVITCSAGNHGWALAYAGQQMNVPVRVYVPASVDPSKLAGIRNLGAQVVVTDLPGYDRTEQFAKSEALRQARPFISPFDDSVVMAANGGSLAAEIAEQLPEARTFLVPVGGGGLAAGLGFFAKRSLPDATLLCAQHRDSPALQMSLDRGRAVTELPPIETAAGGIEGGIGFSTFEHLRWAVDGVLLCSEEQILNAVIWFLEHYHYLIEPSAAVVLAACFAGRMPKLQSPLVIVLTGRNVSLDKVQRILGTRS